MRLKVFGKDMTTVILFQDRAFGVEIYSMAVRHARRGYRRRDV